MSLTVLWTLISIALSYIDMILALLLMVRDSFMVSIRSFFFFLSVWLSSQELIKTMTSPRIEFISPCALWGGQFTEWRKTFRFC